MKTAWLATVALAGAGASARSAVDSRSLRVAVRTAAGGSAAVPEPLAGAEERWTIAGRSRRLRRCRLKVEVG